MLTHLRLIEIAQSVIDCVAACEKSNEEFYVDKEIDELLDSGMSSERVAKRMKVPVKRVRERLASDPDSGLQFATPPSIFEHDRTIAAARALQGELATLNVDDNCWRAKELALVADDFIAVWIEGDELAQRLNSGRNLDDKLRPLVKRAKSALEHLRRAIERPDPKPPRPARQLRKEGHSLDVIAREFGFMLRFNGEYVPDVMRAACEVSTPGSEFDAATWIGPELLKREHDTIEAWHKRVKPPEPPLCPEKIRKLRREEETRCPETLEELIEQQVPTNQIMRMKNVTREEVAAKISEMAEAKANESDELELPDLTKELDRLLFQRVNLPQVAAMLEIRIEEVEARLAQLDLGPDTRFAHTLSPVEQEALREEEIHWNVNREMKRIRQANPAKEEPCSTN